MQEKDAVSIEYFENPARFADLINGYVYQGQQVVQKKDVRELNRTIFRIGKSGKKIEAHVATTDVIKEIHHDMYVTVFILENQTDIHYAMPVRVMNEESSYYHRQWRQIANQHQQDKDLKDAEYLSGFRKDDKLMPVITLVVYWGSDPWDGPRCLKDMLDVNDYPLELQSMIVDHPIHLLEVRKFQHLENFETDIRYVFVFLQKEKNRLELESYVAEHNAVFSELTEEAYDMISVMSQSKALGDRKKDYESEGGYNMCQAIEEMIEDGRKEGVNIICGLFRYLQGENRMEDVMLAIKDRAYCDRLLEEYRKRMTE